MLVSGELKHLLFSGIQYLNVSESKRLETMGPWKVYIKLKEQYQRVVSERRAAEVSCLKRRLTSLLIKGHGLSQ